VFLVLALVIGALTGLAVVTFILLTERWGWLEARPGDVRCFQSRARWASVTCCIATFRMREEAEYRRRRLGFRARRTNHATHRTWKVSLRLGNACQRNPARRRRTLGSNWWGHCLCARRPLGLRAEQVMKLIPVGAAAAIAAAFNTPLAAVLFSLEEIMGDLHAPVMAFRTIDSRNFLVVSVAC
jgi:CIC family chloride channel protein